MHGTLQSWLLFALGSAFFAALTAIFAKLGVSDLNSNLATVVRTVVILLVTVLIVSMRAEWQRPEELPARSMVFLVLSGIATGLSWVCYFRALEIGPVSGVVSVDKLSVVLVVALSALLVGERPTWHMSLGAALVALGAILVSLPMKDGRPAPPSRIGPAATPLATIATPMPDQRSRGRTPISESRPKETLETAPGKRRGGLLVDREPSPLFWG